MDFFSFSPLPPKLYKARPIPCSPQQRITPMSTSTIELSITGVNAHSAPNIPPDMAHNSDTRTQLPPLAATSNHFSSSYSTPTTVINLPRYPLQAHINSYPPPQVVDTTLAPGSENVAVMPVCTQPQTGIQPNVVCTFPPPIYPEVLIISRTAGADSGHRR